MIVLSILVPIYNVERYVERCINSLYYQNLDLNEFEVIIINDGSKDSSVEIVNELSNKFTNIKIIHQDNKGLGRARNTGIANASGEYIHFVDSDDYIAKGVYPILLKNAVDRNLDILIFKMKMTESTREISDSDDLIEPNIREILTGIEYISSQGYITTSTISLIKREFLLETGIQFKTGLFEDTLFITSLISFAKRIAFLPLDVYRYQINNSNSIMNKKSNYHLKRGIISLKKVAQSINDLIINKKNEGVEKPDYYNALYRLRSGVCTSLMIYIIRATPARSAINKLLNELSISKLYPLSSNIVNRDSVKYKLFLFIFNNKLLFNTSVKLYWIYGIAKRKKRLN